MPSTETSSLPTSLDRYAAADRDAQARAKLLELALEAAAAIPCPGCAAGECDGTQWNPLVCPFNIRQRAGFYDPSAGPWSAAGLAAAMEAAGLAVPARGALARRLKMPLFDFVAKHGTTIAAKLRTGPQNVVSIGDPEPGDVIGWMRAVAGIVAAIVAVDDATITVVQWDDDGRVAKLRLWRNLPVRDSERYMSVTGRGEGLYGIARPAAAQAPAGQRQASSS